MSVSQDIKINVDLGDATASVRTLNDLKEAFEKAEGGAGIFGSAIKALQNPLLAIPLAVGSAVAAIDKITESSAHAAESLAQIGIVAAGLGLSTDKLQALQAAALQSGVGIQTFNTAFERFNVNTQAARTGQGAFAEDLRKLGISLVDTNGNFKDSSTLLLDLATAFQQGNVGSKQLQDSFGRGTWAQMANMLKEMSTDADQLATNAKKIGLLVPESTIENAKKAADALAVVKQVEDTFKNESLVNLSAAAIQWEKIKNSISNIPLNILSALDIGGTSSNAKFQSMSSSDLATAKANAQAEAARQATLSQGAFSGLGGFAADEYDKQLAIIKQINDIESERADTAAKHAMHEVNVDSAMASEVALALKLNELAQLREDLSHATLDDDIKHLQNELAVYNLQLQTRTLLDQNKDAASARANSADLNAANAFVAANADQSAQKSIDALMDKSPDLMKKFTEEASKSIPEVPLNTWDQALLGFDEVVKKHSSDWKQDFNQVFGDMTTGIVNFVTTGKFSFKSFTAEILTDLAKIAVEKGLAGIFGLVLDAVGGPTAASSSSGAAGITRAARGNTFAFASGGLTNGYTQIGNAVMGEQNMEAVLPLTRDKSGNLGVASTGGDSSGGDVYNVSVTVQSNGNDDKKQGSTIAKAIMERIADARIENAQRAGNSLTRRN